MLYDSLGRQIEKSAGAPNLDPTFFFPAGAGNQITASEIENQPYKFQWTVYSCARTISWNVSRLPRFLDPGKVTKAPVLDILNRPNAFMTRGTLWQAIILNLLLPDSSGVGGGQCFLVGELNGNKCDFTKGEIPNVLFCYGTNHFQAKFDGTGKTKRWIGWDFQPPNTSSQGDRITYLPSEVIRICNFNPYDWFSGIANYFPAKLAILNDIKANIWNNRTYDNDAVPAGILHSKSSGPIDKTDRDEIRKTWYQNQGGPGNARRVAVLGSELEYQQIALNQKDMEFIKQKEAAIEEITSAFGLNKIALGKYESINYATIVEGRRMLWEDTYIPIDDIILDAINQQWIKFINPRQEMSLVSDTSKIRVLQADYSKPMAAAKTMYDMGVTTAVALRVNNIPITEEDLAAQPWLNEQPVKPSPFSFPPSEEPVPPAKSVQKIVKLSPESRAKFSDSYIARVLDPGEKTMLTRLVKFFNAQRNEMQDKVDAYFRNKKAIEKADKEIDPGAFLLDVDKETDKMVKQVYRPQVKEQLAREALELEAELGDLIHWAVSDPMISGFVSQRRKFLEKINTTTFNACRDKIADAIEEGSDLPWTISDYSKAIKEAIAEVGEIRKNQSVMIARTETGTISNNARNDCFKEEGVEYKQWITAGDEKVRETHVAEDGEILPMDERFANSGLMYPMEPGGDAGEVINCRCTLVAMRSPKEED